MPYSLQDAGLEPGTVYGALLNDPATVERLASGTGREGGTWSYEVFLEHQSIAVSMGSHHIPHWGA